MKHRPTTRIGRSRLWQASAKDGARLGRVDTVISASDDARSVIAAVEPGGACDCATRLVLIATPRLDPRILASVPPTLAFQRVIALPGKEGGTPAQAAKEPSLMVWWFGKPPRRNVSNAPCVGTEWETEGRPDPRLAWLVSRFENKDDVSVDPVMTDPSVGDACATQGMRFTGYCPTANSYRIACEVFKRRHAQGQLFDATPAADQGVRQTVLF